MSKRDNLNDLEAYTWFRKKWKTFQLIRLNFGKPKAKISKIDLGDGSPKPWLITKDVDQSRSRNSHNKKTRTPYTKIMINYQKICDQSPEIIDQSLSITNPMIDHHFLWSITREQNPIRDSCQHMIYHLLYGTHKWQSQILFYPI